MAKLKAKEPDPKAPGKAKGLLFGPTGVGKTWLALSFPKPVMFDTEGGAKLGHYQQRLKDAGGAYLGPRDGTLEFDFLIEQIDALSTEKHGYKTLVVDSITKIFQTAIQKESERLGVKDVFGASKKPAVAMMRKLIGRIDRLDMNVWFIAHETTEWGQVDGKREEIGKIPDVWDKLPYELDLTLRIQKHSSTLRTATVYKTRLTGFPDGERFDLLRGKDDVGYSEFISRYGKDFIEGEVKTIVIATPEQVDAIKRLLGVVNVPETEIEKVLTKAGVDDWASLTFDQAAATIKWIEGKVK